LQRTDQLLKWLIFLQAEIGYYDEAAAILMATASLAKVSNLLFNQELYFEEKR
jgi:hypothetical protein